MNINKITARLKAVASGRLNTAVYAIVYTAILFFAIGFILGRLL